MGSKGGIGGVLGTIGGITGGIIGGPAGAATGTSIGSAVGGAFDQYDEGKRAKQANRDYQKKNSETRSMLKGAIETYYKQQGWPLPTNSDSTMSGAVSKPIVEDSTEENAGDSGQSSRPIVEAPISNLTKTVSDNSRFMNQINPKDVSQLALQIARKVGK